MNMGHHQAALKEIGNAIDRMTVWKAETIGEEMQKTARKLDLKNSEFFMLLRVALTGKKISPPLNESMEILGKEECLRRVNELTG